ncbi:hypothetical protein [Streptomyces tremellae]|uniref:hypothetical protein n=1 Tax=Streptomyces tremellae TaxID=1124239 RepID=UPI0031E77F48
MCSTRPDDSAGDSAEPDADAVRRALWKVRSQEVATIECPTCGAARRDPCRTLWDRPTTALHRGRTLRYLKIRFALDLAEPHLRPAHRRPAPELPGPGLRATRPPHAQPWRLPLHELADLINLSFLDLAKVVTAHAQGLQRTGLDELLFGPDRIHQSIDALTYARHDRLLHHETRILSGCLDQEARRLAEQEKAVRDRLLEVKRHLKEQRISELTAAGILPFPPATNDSRRLARSWLGRYLADEKEHLVRSLAAAAGVAPSASVHIRCIREKITRCIDNGWLAAPLTDTVQQTLDLDAPAFERRVIADATRHADRDDTLCHPLVLNRWRDQLNTSLTRIAPTVENPHTRYLKPLTLNGPTPSSARREQLHRRRRLFAALLQRRDESLRLITTLNDGMSIAERRDPSHALMKKIGDQTYDELVRRHPELYRHIRACLARYETRYGRLQIPEPRAQLRTQIFDELDQIALRRPAGPPARR